VAAFPQFTSNGEQFGGTIGFLKTLRKLVNEIQPKQVYVCWESGGSTKRRAIFKEYKMGRSPERLNRFYGEDLQESQENRSFQTAELIGILKHVPVCQLYVPDCEGDDVVAYLCKNKLNEVDKVVASSDKDFYQLLDAKTRIYSFHKKTFILAQQVFDEFRISTRNWAVAKAIVGEPVGGDNIPSIKGVGFKTASKYFPMLGTDTDVLLQHIFDYSNVNKGKQKIYEKVLEGTDIIKRNYRLVYLGDNTLSLQQQTQIDNQMLKHRPKTNKLEIMRTLAKHGISDFNVDDFVYSFNCIEGIRQN
jgi:5'-3' exonuclease